MAEYSFTPIRYEFTVDDPFIGKSIPAGKGLANIWIEEICL